MKVVIVSGGFDPIHSGHLEYFNHAKELGDLLVVAINSDDWLKRKKGKEFMPFQERKMIISNLKMVDIVIAFEDSDGSACDALHKVLSLYPNDDIVFANGGDRVTTNTPELLVYGENPRVSFEWMVGGSNKMNSSSWILDNWKTNKTVRDWGYWRVLDDKKTTKVKELVIYPNKSLSDQKHSYRSEHWYVMKGECNIELNGVETKFLSENQSLLIPTLTWHRAYNTSDQPCHVLEVQYGEKCEEDDIIRRNG